MAIGLDQTRPIYQRKLLEVLTHQTIEGYESDEPFDPINDENTLYPDLIERKKFSYGLPNRYDEPMTIRNEYKATKSTRSTYRLIELICKRVKIEVIFLFIVIEICMMSPILLVHVLRRNPTNDHRERSTTMIRN